MKLVHPDWEKPVILDGTKVPLISIENHNTLKPQIAFSCIGSLQVYPLTPGGATLGSVSLFKDLA